MSKQITITFRDHVFDAWLRDYKGNKSAFIEENFVKGVEIVDAENFKVKYTQLVKDNRFLEEQIKQKNAEIQKLKNRLDPQHHLTPDNVFSGEEYHHFKELMDRSPFRRDLLFQAVATLNRDNSFFDGLYSRWKNETGDEISSVEFNKLIVMFRKLKEEEKQNEKQR